MEEKEQLIDYYRKMYLCMINKDIKSLDDLLDSSFVLVHMTGTKESSFFSHRDPEMVKWLGGVKLDQ